MSVTSYRSRAPASWLRHHNSAAPVAPPPTTQIVCRSTGPPQALAGRSWLLIVDPRYGRITCRYCRRRTGPPLDPGRPDVGGDLHGVGEHAPPLTGIGVTGSSDLGQLEQGPRPPERRPDAVAGGDGRAEQCGGVIQVPIEAVTNPR